MNQFDPITIDPEHIAVSKSKGIKIDWRDKHHSEYDLQYLRDRCPCAQCTGVHGAPPVKEKQNQPNPLQMFKPALKIQEVEPIGNYALRLKWNDGHNTGIYSYEHFRRICPCPVCRSQEASPVIQ